MSGMLSKNADTNPSASAFCQEGDGNDSTGISEAEATRQRRKIDPFTAPGRMLQSGRRQPAVSAMAAATAAPMNGKRDEISGCVAFTPTLTATALARMNMTITTRGQSITCAVFASLMIGA